MWAIPSLSQRFRSRSCYSAEVRLTLRYEDRGQEIDLRGSRSPPQRNCGLGFFAIGRVVLIDVTSHISLTGSFFMQTCRFIFLQPLLIVFALALAPAAFAESIVYTPVPSLVIDGDTGSNTYPNSLAFNVFTGEAAAGDAPAIFPAGTYIASFSAAVFTDNSVFGDGDPEGETFYYTYNFADEDGQLLNLSPGTYVDSALVGFVHEQGQPENMVIPTIISDHGFAGFSYQSSISSTVLYGWFEWATDETIESMTVLRFGYENSGAPALIPTSIPEPAVSALAAALIAITAVLIRRRQGRQ